MSNTALKHIGIFGPTGYIGTRLIIDLYNQGYKLSLFARNIRKLSYLQQNDCTLLSFQEPRVCVIESFLEEKNFNTLCQNLQGIDTVYYLVHSLGTQENDFLIQDNKLASLVARAASRVNVKQIVYLGGLGVDLSYAPLSKHLKSRQETGNHLRRHHACVTELRAGVIIGAGSASFEIIRSLGMKLPFLPLLHQREGLCQPIFVDDVIAYLKHVLLNNIYYGKIAEVGSDNVLSYGDMVKIFAKTIVHKNLQRIPLPIFSRLLTSNLLSFIIAKMTQMPYLLVRSLIEGMSCDAVVDKYPINKIDPLVTIRPLCYRDSIRIAMVRTEGRMINSVWSTPYESSVMNAQHQKQFISLSSKEIEGMLFEEYSRHIGVEQISCVFDNIKDIGGDRGYFSPKWLWSIRGFIDKLLGGPGLSSYKVDKNYIKVGSRIDFWVVTYYRDWTYEKTLRLKAKMKSPGHAWLQFSIKTSKDKQDAVLSLKAYFEPIGIFGYIYWYSLYFIHKYIFRTMVNNIIDEATSNDFKHIIDPNNPLKL